MTESKSTKKEPHFNANCNHCGNGLYNFTNDELYQHLAKHKKNVYFSNVSISDLLHECNECPARFQNKKSLQYHVRRSHGENN